MNDREILDRLWEAYRETPFASLMMQRKLDLRHNELPAVLNLIGDMADRGETQNGYRIKRVADTVFKMTQAQAASTVDKMTQAQQEDSDPPKGLPLTTQNEAVLGQSESDPPSTDGENGENHTQGQDDPFPDAENQAFARGSRDLQKVLNLQNMNIGCLLLPLRSGIPVFRTAQDKADFDESLLWGWEYLRDATPRDIVQYADKGRVFVPGQFVKCRETQRFRHTKATWQRTQMIACDADQIKGVELDNEGNDKTPGGVEAFTDPKRLLELYPALPSEAYAIGHSLSSLLKPPPHIRCRIYFVLEHSIRSETDYKWLLLGLSTAYPIISASRQPAQPVYGNAGKRRIFKDEKVQELPQPFQTRIFDNLLSAERISEIVEIGKQAELDEAAAQQEERHREKKRGTSEPLEQTANRSTESTESCPVENQTTLTEWLSKNNIPNRGERDGKYLFVDCPWENQHTSDFGAKDTAVWGDDDFGFCFRCLHAHCDGRGWEDYRQAIAPRENTGNHRHGFHTQRNITRNR